MKRIKIKALRYHEFIEYEMNGPTQEFLIAEHYKLTENQRQYWFITKDQSFAKRFNLKENWVHINLINGWYIGFLKNSTVSGIDMMSMEQLRPKIESIIKGQHVIFFNKEHMLIHVDKLIGIRHDSIQYVRVDINGWLEGNDHKCVGIQESDFDEYMVHEPGDPVVSSQSLYAIDNEFGKALYDNRLAEIMDTITNLKSKPLFGTGYQIESPDGVLMTFRDIFELHLDCFLNEIDRFLVPWVPSEEGWEVVITRLYYIKAFLPKEVIGMLSDSGYTLLKVTAERMDMRWMIDKYLVNTLINIEELDWSILNTEIPY